MFALFCAHLRSFPRICVFLHPTAFRTTAFGNCRFQVDLLKLSLVLGTSPALCITEVSRALQARNAEKVSKMSRKGLPSLPLSHKRSPSQKTRIGAKQITQWLPFPQVLKRPSPTFAHHCETHPEKHLQSSEKAPIWCKFLFFGAFSLVFLL